MDQTRLTKGKPCRERVIGERCWKSAPPGLASHPPVTRASRSRRCLTSLAHPSTLSNKARLGMAREQRKTPALGATGVSRKERKSEVSGSDADRGSIAAPGRAAR
jgi:hypothetical protein